MNGDAPLTRVTDNGTVYSIKSDGPTLGHEGFTILMMDDETGGWDRVFGGFSAKRVNGVFDPSTLKIETVMKEERTEAVTRMALNFLGLRSK